MPCCFRKHNADSVPCGLLLRCGRGRCDRACKWLPARDLLCGRRFICGLIQLPALRLWRLLGVRVRVFHRKSLLGGPLLPHCIHKHYAGSVRRGLLLPRRHGLGHRIPMPRGHVLAWREHVRVHKLLHCVRRWLLPCSRQHLFSDQPLRSGLLLLLRHGQHAAGGVPRGLLLPLGHRRCDRKPVPRWLLLPLWLARGSDRVDQPVPRWRVPSHWVGHERRVAVHGGLLLRRRGCQQDAGRVPAGVLLPRGRGRRHG